MNTSRTNRLPPKKPLTLKQKNILAKNCWNLCLRSYTNRMKQNGLISDIEKPSDLEPEAYIAMWNILDRFDTSNYGLLAKHDESGPRKPKTLEFYFLNYFYGRVNLIASKARILKK